MYKGNILLVIDSLGIGGAEKVTLTLAKGFYQKGYKVDLIICDNIIGFEVPNYINLHILDFKKSFLDYFRYSRKLHKMVDDIKEQNGRSFDLILVHLQKATRLMKNYKHKNIYYYIHSNFTQSSLKDKTKIKQFFRKRKLQKIYNNLKIITVSEGIKEDLIKVIKIKPKSIQTIYNPIDFEEIKKFSLEKSPINEKDYIVHVGRFVKQKRHDILLKAFKLANLDTKLVLVGDGEEKENIKNLIKELNLEDKVILTGFLQNPYPVIKNAKLLVLSSEYEGFGIVLVEALVLNTCAISTNCPFGPNEILSNDLNKYLVEVNNIDKLSLLIKNVYKKRYIINYNNIKKFNLEYVGGKYEKIIN